MNGKIRAGLFLFVLGGLLIAQSLTAATPAAPAAPAAADKPGIVNSVTGSYMYFNHDFSETEKDPLGANTNKIGAEKGDINGGSLLYEIRFPDPAVFLSLGVSYSYGMPVAGPLYLLDGTQFNDQTEDTFITGDLLVGYALDFMKQMSFKMDIASGVGFRGWYRLFKISDTRKYTEDNTCFYVPWNFAFEYILLNRVGVGVEASLKVPFSAVDTFEMKDYGPTATDYYLDPKVVLPDNPSYRVGVLGKYYFQDLKAAKPSMGVGALTVNPYIDFWSTGKSDTTTVYSTDDATPHTTFTPTAISITKWENMTLVYGLRLALNFVF
jgi:hypothetical protein